VNLAILGPPGSGKGTQSLRLAKKLGIVHISTGDILRGAVRKKTPLGMEANDYLRSGQLVPDEIMIDIVKERIHQKDCSKGFLLDGFPRTIPQAKMLDEVGSFGGSRRPFLDFVISLELSERECVRRIANRRTCSQCGLTYNPLIHPPKRAGKCDRDGAKLILRDDDRPATVKERLKVYHRSTQPLVDYYRSSNRLFSADAASAPAEVSKRLSGLFRDALVG
jgi:adenylate kinase